MAWDLALLAAGYVSSVLLGFASFAYLSRILPPESYGLVEYAVGLAGLAAMIIEGGMGSVAALAVARDTRRAPRLAAGVPVARLIVAAAVIPIVGFSGRLTGLNGSATGLLWLYAISLLAIPFKQDWLFQGLDRMNYVAPAQAVKSAAFAIGVLVAVRDGADLLTVGALEVLAATAGALYFVAAQRAVSIRPSLDLRWSRLWPLMRSGAVVGASNVVWPFIVYAPIFLVTNLAGAAQAAWLGSVQRIVVALVSFSALYFFNLYPLMARALSHQRHHWPRLIESSFRLVAWSTIGGALAIMLTSDAIVRAAFGPRFAAAGAVMAIYVWVLPIRLLSGHARWALVAAERQGVLLLTESGCAFTLVLGGVALVPTYGATGAAVAAVVATAIGWAFAHVGARRVAGPMPAVGGALLPAAAALLSAAVAWGGSKDQAGRLVIAVVVYGGCMWFAARDICSDIKWLAHAKRLVADSPVAADA